MIGRSHRMKSGNNQDSWSIWSNDVITVGIVADGCGSCTRSEVGAVLGSQLLGVYLYETYNDRQIIDLVGAKKHLLDNLGNLASTMGPHSFRWIEDHLLFTVVGVAVTEKETIFFACGDGMIIVNGMRMSLGPFEGNMPPYLGYGLLGHSPEMHSLDPVLVSATDEVSTFMIATDGVDDLIANEQSVMPGMERFVGGIEQFWEEDRYFNGNPELVSRQLKIIGRDWPMANPSPGLLADDTTLIVGRKRT